MDTLCHENDDGFGTDGGATMNIGGWLRNLGLERYEPVFIENAIDSDVLPVLTRRFRKARDTDGGQEAPH
jgi:hypothetical protein